MLKFSFSWPASFSLVIGHHKSGISIDYLDVLASVLHSGKSRNHVGHLYEGQKHLANENNSLWSGVTSPSTCCFSLSNAFNVESWQEVSERWRDNGLMDMEAKASRILTNKGLFSAVDILTRLRIWPPEGANVEKRKLLHIKAPAEWRQTRCLFKHFIFKTIQCDAGMNWKE